MHQLSSYGNVSMPSKIAKYSELYKEQAINDFSQTVPFSQRFLINE